MSDADRPEGPGGSSRSPWPPGSHDDGPGRLEAHNASVDEQLADEGACARSTWQVDGSAFWPTTTPAHVISSPPTTASKGYLQDETDDPVDAAARAVHAANRGDASPLRHLVIEKERARDFAAAEALAVQAAERGDTFALRELARRRQWAGDIADAEILFRRAGDYKDSFALRELAALRERAGDVAGAETLYLEAADHGDAEGLEQWAEMRERTGNTSGADRLRRFGLTGSGDVATTLDFSSDVATD